MRRIRIMVLAFLGAASFAAFMAAGAATASACGQVEGMGSELQIFAQDSEFIPGFNAVAAPLAAISGLRRARFVLFDTLGALAWMHDHHATLWDVAGAAPVLLEAGGALTALDGSPLFPIDPDGYAGEPVGFLAGDPQAHDEALRELTTAR